MIKDKVIVIDNAIDEQLITDFVNTIDANLFIDIGKSTYAQTQTDFQIKYYTIVCPVCTYFLIISFSRVRGPWQKRNYFILIFLNNYFF